MDKTADGNENYMENELERFEKKLNTLLEHTKALRHANEILRRDLAGARAENRMLSDRAQEAATRIEALIQHLPEAE